MVSRGEQVVETCGKDITTSTWWWLMETFLLNDEQWNGWRLAREEKQGVSWVKGIKEKKRRRFREAEQNKRSWVEAKQTST